MATILHPTRGGQSSYANQDKAIALARERNERLVLLYVSNVHFLDTLASPVPIDLVKAELDELGEFMLAMAQERAEKAGVMTDAAVRQGMFNQALIEVIEEFGVETVVLGSPADDTAVMTAESVQELVRFLLAQTSTEVIVLHDGEIVGEHSREGNESQGG